MKKPLLLVAIILTVAGQSALAQTESRLAADRTVFVSASEKKELDSALLKELQKWGRWKLINEEASADLLIVPTASGVTLWNSSAGCKIIDRSSKEILWVSKVAKKSSWTYNAQAIVKQMRKEIK